MIGISYLMQAFRLIWQHGTSWLLCSMTIRLLNGLLPGVSTWVTMKLVNSVSLTLQGHSTGFRETMKYLMVQFLIAVILAVLHNLQAWLDQHIEIKMSHHLQYKLTDKLTTVPYAYFELPRFYHHLSRISSGLGRRFLDPVKSLFDIFQSAVSLLSFLGFLLTIHWSFLPLSLVAAIPMLLLQIKFGKQRFWMLLHQTPVAREAAYLAQLTMDRQGAKEIRLFGLAPYLKERWSKKYLQNAGEALQLTRRQQGISVILEALSALFYMVAMAVMVWLMQTRSLQIGDFVSMGQAIMGAQNSINQLAFHFAGLYERGLYIRDFFEFLAFEEPSIPSSSSGTHPFPEVLQEGISFHQVSFAYPDSERPVLQNVSFQIAPGEKIAIVGENGSGKTTLVKCMMGLFPITSGDIRFDGIPLQQIRERELYKNITAIFQDFMKYALTLRENIALSDIERADDLASIAEAAQKSGLKEAIQKLRDGYDTPLDRVLFDGDDVSGGQWQKIAIARALFRGGQIIVLDEPTAALDPQAELEIFRQFHRMTEQKTALFISHRMAAARMADRIFVMKEGQIVEAGTHDELYASGGEYYRMYRTQEQWFTEETNELEEVMAWKN